MISIIIAEPSARAMLPAILAISAVSVAITGGVAWLLFYVARRLKQAGKSSEGAVIALVFAWMAVLLSALCAGCGVIIGVTS